MATVTIGDVAFRASGSMLMIAKADSPGISVRLDAESVEDLIDFVTGLAETEFNRRQHFRIPLEGNSGLSVEIRKGKSAFTATPLNISVSGMLIEAPADRVTELPLDAHVEVVLELDGISHAYPAIVRRHTDRKIGLVFVESVRKDETAAQTQLAALVMELQRRWMIRGARHA